VLEAYVNVTNLIVSIAKFSIVIGSPRAYLPRNWRAITWVSDYRSPISTFNWIPEIGYPRDSHVNYARFKMVPSHCPDSCDIGSQVQCTAEFTSQVMNFPIKYNNTKIKNRVRAQNNF